MGIIEAVHSEKRVILSVQFPAEDVELFAPSQFPLKLYFGLTPLPELGLEVRLSVLFLQFFADELVDHLRIGLPFRRFHHLADEKSDGPVFSVLEVFH